MKSSGALLCAISVLSLAPIATGPSRTPAAAEKSAVRSVRPEPQLLAKAQKTAVLVAYGRLPLHFEAKRGQTDPQVKFLTSTAASWRYTAASWFCVSPSRPPLQLTTCPAASRASRSMGARSGLP